MAIHNVSSTSELKNALNRATGGDVIELAAGDYGDFSMRRTHYDSEVTVRSADPDNPAVFNSINITDSSHVTFDSIFIDFTPTESTVEWESAFRAVQGVSNITLRNSKVEGGDSIGGVSPDSDPGEQGKNGILGEPIGRAITATGTNLTIENNEITHFFKGIVTAGDGNAIVGNDIYGLRTSPVVGGGSNLLIDGNYFHDSNPWKMGGRGDHGDYVHLWTNSSGPSSNITITNNVFSDENGGPLLGIYLDDNRRDIGFKNVVVEDNVIYSTTTQAVRFENVSEASISRNTILNPNDSEKKGSLIILKDGTKNVHLEDNIVSTFFGEDQQLALVEKGFTFKDNLDVNYSDPSAENYIGRILTDSTLEGSGLWERAVVPESAADGLGAALLHLDEQTDRLTPIFEVEKAGEEDEGFVLRADLSRGPDGTVSASDAQFIWDFGDGTGAIGQLVRHAYAEAGRYEATLTVVTPDGAIATAKSEIAILGADVLSFDPQTGFLQTEKYGEDTAVTDSDRGSIMTDDGYGIDLGAPGVATSASKSQIARLFGAESFDMSMTLRADTLGSTGLVAQAASNFMLSIVDRGEVSFRLWTDEGHAKLTTTRITVNDGEDHDIRIAFDSAASRLEIHVDGALAAATEIEGAMRGDFPRALHFGHAWGKQNFDGTLTAFDLDVGNRDYPNYVGDASVIPGDAIPLDALPRIEQDAADPVQEEPPQTTAPDEQETQEDSGAPEEVPTSEDHTEAPVDDTPLPPDETETQDPTVVVDAERDRIEVILDDDTTPDTTDPDPVPVSSDPVGYVRGGEISTAWARHFDSDINDTDDSEIFVDDAVALT